MQRITTYLLRSAAMVMAVLLSVSCTKDGEEPRYPHASRVVLVYMAGDNSLGGYVRDNLDAMRRGLASAPAGSRTIAYVDTPGGNPRLVEITASGTKTLHAWPSPHNSTKWFGQDTGENPAGYLDVEQLSEAIPSGVFDWILFDACFMASAETLYALRDKAERIVCSPAEVIADGFPYAEIMAELLRPEPDLRAVCATYYRNYADDPRPAYRSATVSLVETSQLEALVGATASVLGAALATDPEALAGMELDRLQPLDRYRRHFLFDMGSVVGELETRGLVPASLAGAWRAQLARTVIYEAHTPTMLGLALDECCGLSMYVPYADYADLNEYYRTLDWYRQCYPTDFETAQ